MIDIHDSEVVASQFEMYKGARGPYTGAGMGNIVRRDGFFLVDQNGVPHLDYHGDILCHVLGQRNTMQEVSALTDGLGRNIVSADFSHPFIDELRGRLRAHLAEELGEDYEVEFASGGTAANTAALRVSQATLEGKMHIMSLDEGYHGNGAVMDLLRHPTWHQKHGADLPSRLPMSFADFEDTPTGRDFSADYRAKAERIPDGFHPHLIAEGGVQGVAGFRKIDLASLQRMAIDAHSRGGHVHYDGVQTQPWRTGSGRFFPAGLVNPRDSRTIPDFVTSAKGSGDGEPLAWVAFRKEVMEAARTTKDLGKGYDTAGQTLRGAVAGILVDEAVSNPAFQENIRARAEQTTAGFDELIDRFPGIVKGRDGMGLMQSLVLQRPDQVATFRKIGVSSADALRMVVGAGGLKGDVLRFGGKLDATEEITAEMLNRTRGILEEMERA